MDLRRSRLTALSITQSGFWPPSPRMCLVPPKNEAESTWTVCNQPAATAVNTLRVSVLISELKCSCFSPVNSVSPKAHSSPAFWSTARFRSSSARFFTKYSEEQLTVVRSAEEWMWVNLWLCKQTSAPHIPLDVVNTSSRSSRRQNVVLQCLLLVKSIQRCIASFLSSGRNFEHKALRLESKAARSLLRTSAGRKCMRSKREIRNIFRLKIKRLINKSTLQISW